MMALGGETRKDLRLDGARKRYEVDMQRGLEARERGLNCRTEEEQTAEVERRRLMKEMGAFNMNRRSIT
jgi:hypothetical protein